MTVRKLDEACELLMRENGIDLDDDGAYDTIAFAIHTAMRMIDEARKRARCHG